MLEYELTQEGSEIIREDICGRLQNGQVGILPTDTVYGLVCISDNDGARDRIYDLKQREHGKPMQNLLADLQQCEQLDIEIGPALRRLAAAFWPGPLTVVLKNRQGAFQGIRIPKNEFVRQVINAVGKPLAATSANRSGEDPHASAAAGFANLAGDPDFVVIHEAGGCPSSTVVELEDDGSINMLRVGTITEDAIKQVLADD